MRSINSRKNSFSIVSGQLFFPVREFFHPRRTNEISMGSRSQLKYLDRRASAWKNVRILLDNDPTSTINFAQPDHPETPSFFIEKILAKRFNKNIHVDLYRFKGFDKSINRQTTFLDITRPSNGVISTRFWPGLKSRRPVIYPLKPRRTRDSTKINKANEKSRVVERNRPAVRAAHSSQQWRNLQIFSTIQDQEFCAFYRNKRNPSIKFIFRILCIFRRGSKKQWKFYIYLFFFFFF